MDNLKLKPGLDVWSSTGKNRPYGKKSATFSVRAIYCLIALTGIEKYSCWHSRPIKLQILSLLKSV